MREAEEGQQWKNLKAAATVPELRFHEFEHGSIDLSPPCIVIGGRNGAGKSRVLREIASALGSKGKLLDLHHLSEQAMILLRSRDDIDDMAEESGLYPPHGDRFEDVQRIDRRQRLFIDRVVPT